MNGYEDEGPCLHPCSRMIFDSRIVKNDPYRKVYGLYIQLEEKVKVLESTFIINEITLLTRIGGIIGVGKEFLWIIILIFGSLIHSLQKLKQKGKFK